MGFFRTGLAVAEGRYAALPLYALCGCLLSAALGWIMIPHYGLTGAALASMASLLISNLAMDLLLYRRHLVWILT
jgi:O-antigen/teichoic acid export membrane protein